MDAPKFWALVNGQESQYQLNLHGEIGEWCDIDEREFAQALAGIPAEAPLAISLNSQGGDVFPAVAIYRAICKWKGPVSITIDGIAASAATLIAAAPNAKVIMPVGSMLMLHSPWSYGLGNAKQLRRVADALDSVQLSMLGIYQAKCGLDEATLVEILDKETYLSPAEALSLGLADEIETGTPVLVQKPHKASVLASIATKEVKKMNKEQILAEYPEVYAEIFDSGKAEGTLSERQRIQAIEDLALPGTETILRAAKYEDPRTAEQVAVAIVRAERGKVQQARVSREQDAAEISALVPVAIPAVAQVDMDAEERARLIAIGNAAFAAKSGGKK